MAGIELGPASAAAADRRPAATRLAQRDALVRVTRRTLLPGGERPQPSSAPVDAPRGPRLRLVVRPPRRPMARRRAPAARALLASEPVLVHGGVIDMRGDTSGDFPSTHVRADVNHVVQRDPEDADRLATGNDDGLLHFEWEAGAYPAWAWAGPGDRVVWLGRWIFYCGHTGATPGACSATTPEQCVLDQELPSGETWVGPHYAYSAELHR